MYRAFLFALSVLTPVAGKAAGRNLLVNPSFEAGVKGWTLLTGRGAQAAADESAAHSGKASLRCECRSAGQICGAMQTLVLDQKRPAALVVSGWSKAKGVKGRPGPNYSIYCDVEYTTDTRPGRVDAPGQVVVFKTGDHDWTFGDRVIQPAAPIKWVKFYVLFRRTYTGAAWFDDLYLGPLASGSLTGSAKDLPALPLRLAPKGFADSLRALDGDRMLVDVAREKEPAGRGDPLRFWLCGELVTRGSAGRVSAARRAVDWKFPYGFTPPPARPFAGVWLRRIRGEPVLDVQTQSKQGGTFRYTIALPRGVAVRRVEFENWEPRFDDLGAYQLNGRVVLSVRTQTQTDSDRVRFHLREPGRPRARAGRTRRRRPAGPAILLRTRDGLELTVAADGCAGRLKLRGRDVTASRIYRNSPDPLSAGAGWYVSDFFRGGIRPVGGRIRRTRDGVEQEAEFPDLRLRVQARYAARPDRIDLEASVQDLAGADRAVDLFFKLPLAVEGWMWREDLTHSRRADSKNPIRTDVYPWFTLTSPDGRDGLTLAVPPHKPCVMSFHCEPAGRLLYARFPLGLTPMSKTPGRAAVSLTLFRTDGRWGFRDAVRRYYAAFPAASKRIAKKEGGWLFACPASRLKNPEDYAYREGGPAGWRLDEKLGLLTCPYRIPTQRQIILPRLPATNADARALVERLSLDANPQSPRRREYAVMMKNCASYDAFGQPYIVRRDNCGADVLPKHPIYNVVYSVNCDPDLFADSDALTVGRYELEKIESMLKRYPKIDGVYLDSTSGWVSRRPNYRREHFRWVDHPLTYDPRTGQVIAPGWIHTYEFMAELQRRLQPRGKIVFPNIGRGRRYPFFYFVCDVIGLEGGLRAGDFESQLNFYRALAGRKPVLVMDYLEVRGQPTRHATRKGFERFWKWCALYGAHPSIGRTCAEAYQRFGDVYRRFRAPLKKLGAAGWRPITYASAGKGLLIERFGDAKSGLYFTVFNPTDKPLQARLEIDAASLGLPQEWGLRDLITGSALSPPFAFELQPEGLRVLAVAAR